MRFPRAGFVQGLRMVLAVMVFVWVSAGLAGLWLAGVADPLRSLVLGACFYAVFWASNPDRRRRR